MGNQPKTIFLTVSRAVIVRNLILNPGFVEFSKKYRVVFLSPLFDDPDFKERFKDFTILPLFPLALGRFQRRLQQIFISCHKALIYNPTIKVASEFGLVIRNEVKFKKLRNGVEKYIFGSFSHLPGVRSFFKWLDKKVFPCRLYDEFFTKYKPAAIFITALGSDDEVGLLRNAKKFGIPSIGMTVSWDNLSKNGLREKAHRLIVWSDYMRDEALRFQNYKEHEIDVVGIPRFDYYKIFTAPSKSEFFQKFGLSLDKKTILFGSAGPTGDGDIYVISVLQSKIQDGTLSGFQVLIRPHFGFRTDIERFMPFVDNKNIFIDTEREQTHFKDGTGLSLVAEKNLLAEIQYSDVIVSSTSTLALDIMANHKQPLLYYFDRDKKIFYGNSVKRYYDTLWFREIRSFKIDNMVQDEDDLVFKIREIIENPAKDEAKREALVKRLCCKIDGKSGERLFACVEKFLEQKR